MSGKIRTKVLRVILSTSLGALVLLSVTVMVSIFNIRNTTLAQSDQLGAEAARSSQVALEAQVRQQIISLAEDKAALADEKLTTIQNQTKMVADIASHIFTYRAQYSPRRIDYLQVGQEGTVPHLSSAPGFSLPEFRNEVYLAANVSDMLRQMMVVDIGIMGSYIGTEDGYSIVVERDAYPNETDYDARTRGWYKGARDAGGIFWTDIFTDAVSKQAAISCAMPFYDLSGGRRVFKGVAGNGTLLSASVNKIIDSTKIGETGYAFVLNAKGQVIFTPKSADMITDEAGNIIGEDYLNSTNPAIRELAQRMLSRESGIMELEMDGQAVYAAFHPLSLIDWSLGVVVSIDEVITPARLIEQDIIRLTREEMKAIDRNIIMIILIVAFIILLAAVTTVFLSARLSNGLTAPIMSLSESARIISGGDLNHRLEVKTGDEIEMLSDTFNQMIDNIKGITAEKERIGAELNVATKIQASMLPSIFPPFPDREEFDIYAEMHPAKEVGGDFYDFFLVDQNRLAVVIADVSGKGVPAALFMVIAKTLIKNHAQMDKPLNEVFYAVNNQLCENNDENMFVTAFIGLLEIDTGKFQYVNAGHNPPVIRHGGGGFDWLTTKPGIILGTMEQVKFKMMETTLEENDMLFMYTDGVNEAMNLESELFSSGRILDVLNRDTEKNNTIHEYIRDMLHEIELFANGAEQADDITMLMLQRKRR